MLEYQLYSVLCHRNHTTGQWRPKLLTEEGWPIIPPVPTPEDPRMCSGHCQAPGHHRGGFRGSPACSHVRAKAAAGPQPVNHREPQLLQRRGGPRLWAGGLAGGVGPRGRQTMGTGEPRQGDSQWWLQVTNHLSGPREVHRPKEPRGGDCGLWLRVTRGRWLFPRDGHSPV